MRFNTERLISEVETRPSIWDCRIPAYSERAVKKAAWEDLCATFVPEYYESTDAERHGIIATFQKKWKGMRDAFLRELKKSNAASASGILFSTKKYAYYENLMFLKPIYEVSVNKNKNDDDSNNESLAVEYENIADSDNDESQCPDNFTENKANSGQTSAILKRKRAEKVDDRVYNLLEDHLRRKKERDVQYEPDRQFLLSLLPDLESIDARLKFDLKFEIMRVIKTYKVEHLKLAAKSQK